MIKNKALRFTQLLKYTWAQHRLHCNMYLFCLPKFLMKYELHSSKAARKFFMKFWSFLRCLSSKQTPAAESYLSASQKVDSNKKFIPDFYDFVCGGVFCKPRVTLSASVKTHFRKTIIMPGKWSYTAALRHLPQHH